MNTPTELYNCESFRKNADLYRKLGYRWNVSANGFQVWHGEEYIHGAGTATPHRKRHYKHCQADVRMYTSHVYSLIERHRDNLKLKTVCN